MREVVDNDNIDEIEIDLKGLMSYIMSRLTIIILIGILAAGVTFVYTKFFVRPQYVSKTKVYILCKQDPKEDYLTASDLAFASQLANDYPQLLISEPILDKVISDLNLGTSIANLDSNIKVELIENTRILQISVTNPEPVQAKKIADKLREVANSRLKEMMDGLEPVKSVNEATLPDKPDSPNISRNTILGFLIGLVI